MKNLQVLAVSGSTGWLVLQRQQMHSCVHACIHDLNYVMEHADMHLWE